MRTRILSSFFIILPYFLLAQTEMADTTKIQEVLINEDRLQIPFNEQSRNVEILTRKEIASLPAASIQELLSYVPGVDIRQRGPFGTQADIGIDGGSFDQTIVLLNGVKISDSQTGHNMLNLPIPVDAIERIEVLRGPASRIYGINGLTGAVNIVTRHVEKSAVYAHLYAGSSFAKVEELDQENQDNIYYGSGFQIGGALHQEDHQHQLYFSKEKSNGQRYNTASDQEKIYYQNEITLNDAHKIQMMSGYIRNKFGANGFYASPGDKESEEIVETIISKISSQHQFGERWYISPRISHRYNDDDYRYYRNDLSKGRSRHYSSTLTADINARYQTPYGDLGIGLESRFEDISSSNIGKHSRANHGIYSEFRTTHFNRLIVNLGVYLNYNTDYDLQIFPGIDLSYLINDQWKISASSGSGQRIPTFTDLYLDQRPGNIGNPNLISENAWQNEVSVQFKNETLMLKGGYFYRDVKNFIDWIRYQVEEPYQAANLGNNKTHGFFTNLNYTRNLTNDQNISVNLGYTYLNPSIINKYDNTYIKYGIQNLDHQLLGNITYQYKALTISSANKLLQRSSNNTYFVTDIHLGYRYKNMELYTNLQNVSNTKYIEIGAVPMPSRWTTIGIKYGI